MGGVGEGGMGLVRAIAIGVGFVWAARAWHVAGGHSGWALWWTTQCSLRYGVRLCRTESLFLSPLAGRTCTVEGIIISWLTWSYRLCG